MENPYFETTHNGQSNRIGCGFLFGLIAFIFLSIYSSSNNSIVKVFDQAGIIDHFQKEKLVDSLRAIGHEIKCNFVIVSETEVNLKKLSIEAELASIKIDNEQNWLWSMLFPRSGQSITFFYSKKPSLLQIRYGRYIKHKAKIAEIDYGKKYNELQQIKLSDDTPDFITIAQRIKHELINLEIPFYKSWIYRIAAIIDDEILPSIAIPQYEIWNGMASIFAIPIYNVFSSFLSNYYLFIGILSLTIVILFMFFNFIFALFGTPTLTSEGRVFFQTTSSLGCIIYLICFMILMITIFPFFGILIISSSYRTEDLLMFQALGLTNSFIVPQDLSWYIILIFLFITIVGKILILPFDNEELDIGSILGFSKSLITYPIIYFIIPAWAVVIITFSIFNFALISKLSSPIFKAILSWKDANNTATLI